MPFSSVFWGHGKTLLIVMFYHTNALPTQTHSPKSKTFPFELVHSSVYSYLSHLIIFKLMTILINDHENKNNASMRGAFILKALTGSCAPYSVVLDVISHSAAGGSSARWQQQPCVSYTDSEYQQWVYSLLSLGKLRISSPNSFFPSSPARDATAGLLIAKTVCNWCSWRKRWEYLRVYWPLCLIWPLMSEVNGALQAGHRGGNPDLWFYHCSSCWKQQVGGL